MLEDDRARDLINVAAEAASAGSRGDARGLLLRALATNPSLELRIRAWRTLASLTDDPTEKRDYLENILLADSTDGLARRDLAVLDGTLSERDIVDPDLVGSSAPSGARRHVETEPLTCSACGGRLAYSPEMGALACLHCGRQRPIDERPEAVAGEDFAVTMWTGRARKAPTSQPVVTCQGCSAVFVVKPGALSVRCFYCGTNSTIQQAESRDLLAPDGIVPIALTEAQARRLVEESEGEGGREVTGGYVPVWVLSFAGQVDWTGVARQQFGDADSRQETVTGTYTVVETVVAVFGTSRLGDLADLALPQMGLNRAVPFDEGYLAGWPAESYDITLEQAAVAARPSAIQKTRDEVVESASDEASRIEVSASRLGIDTFKLVLAPIWLAPAVGDRPLIVVDGRTGQVYSKPGGLLDRLRRSLGIE